MRLAPYGKHKSEVKPPVSHYSSRIGVCLMLLFSHEWELQILETTQEDNVCNPQEALLLTFMPLVGLQQEDETQRVGFSALFYATSCKASKRPVLLPPQAKFSFPTVRRLPPHFHAGPSMGLCRYILFSSIPYSVKENKETCGQPPMASIKVK